MRWGRKRDWVRFFYPGHKDKRGECEGDENKRKANSDGLS
jgi:hypothetical protein